MILGEAFLRVRNIAEDRTITPLDRQALSMVLESSRKTYQDYQKLQARIQGLELRITRFLDEKQLGK